MVADTYQYGDVHVFWKPELFYVHHRQEPERIPEVEQGIGGDGHAVPIIFDGGVGGAKNRTCQYAGCLEQGRGFAEPFSAFICAGEEDQAWDVPGDGVGRAEGGG